MKRKERISIWLTEEEKSVLTTRAERVNMPMRKFAREVLMRRVRSRLDAAIYDEVHRLRIEFNRHGGLLVQMRNRVLNQRASKELRDDLHDVLVQHTLAVEQVRELKASIEEKLQDADQEDSTD